jgi:hypothetical protein
MICTHIATRPGEFHRRFEIAVDFWILVLELDLPATEFHARESSALAIL